MTLSTPWKVAIAEAVVIVFLAVLLFRNPLPKEGSTTVRDSTRSVSRDTTTEEVDLSFLDTNPTPTDTLQESTTSTKTRRPDTAKSTPTAPDTVYVQRTEPILTYRRPVTRLSVDGHVTTVVQGEMLRQRLDLSVQQRTITTRIQDRISVETTRVLRPRLEVLGAASARLQGLDLDPMVGLGIRLPGTGSLIYQHGLTTGAHNVTLTTPLLSL
jgi:hypothetical protein